MTITVRGCYLRNAASFDESKQLSLKLHLPFKPRMGFCDGQEIALASSSLKSTEHEREAGVPITQRELLEHRTGGRIGSRVDRLLTDTFVGVH